MEEINTSFVTDSSAGTEICDDAVSFNDEYDYDDDEAKNESFVTDSSTVEGDQIGVEVQDGAVMDGVNDEVWPTLFEIPSFPTNPTLTDSSSWISSSSLALPPKIIEVRPRCSRRNSYRRRSNNTESNHSSPYAQLCFDPNQKTLVTMLEIDIVSGRRKHVSRLPLDGPTHEDFPWLHPAGVSALSSSSCSLNESAVSSLSGEERNHGNTDQQEGYGEPIILSGWMMDHDSMNDEEADIYWLLNDGKDVWVKLDDGCGKVIKKIWMSCSQWRLKRITPCSQQQPESPNARDEKRLRYSTLH